MAQRGMPQDSRGGLGKMFPLHYNRGGLGTVLRLQNSRGSWAWYNCYSTAEGAGNDVSTTVQQGGIAATVQQGRLGKMFVPQCNMGIWELDTSLI